jgi:hypothetical protein
MLDKMKHKFKKWDIVMYTMLSWVKKKVMVLEQFTSSSYLVVDQNKETRWAREFNLKIIPKEPEEESSS